MSSWWHCMYYIKTLYSFLWGGVFFCLYVVYYITANIVSYPDLNTGICYNYVIQEPLLINLEFSLFCFYDKVIKLVVMYLYITLRIYNKGNKFLLQFVNGNMIATKRIICLISQFLLWVLFSRCNILNTSLNQR